jgi:hypothetical protein
MSRDDILRMAAKSNIALYGMGLEREKFIRHLEQFAALVASAEREACAKVADHYSMHDQDTPADIAEAIRARGQA